MTRFTLDKFKQPIFRVSVPNSGHESFFIAQNRTTAAYTVFGPTADCTAENMDFADYETFHEFNSAAEYAAETCACRTLHLEQAKHGELSHA